MSTCMVWLQDPQSGEPAHGTLIRGSHLYGISVPGRSRMVFVAQFEHRDKHHCVKITGAYSVSGIVERAEGLEKVRFRTPKQTITAMMGFETTEIEWKDCDGADCLLDHPKEVRHFTGLGHWMYVPWAISEPVEINFYVYDGKLVYVYFETPKEDFDEYLSFRDHHRDVMIKGNTKRA